MALTQFQKLELNKRVDKIFHAPSNAPAGGHQPEIAFVAALSKDMDLIHTSIKDAVASLKAHDKMFQNMRSNMVYWGTDQISSEVMPMSFILMGKAFDGINYEQDTDEKVDKFLKFEELCGYLKLYHARCRCILVFVDCSYEELEARRFYVSDVEMAKQHLNPFLKYRLLIVARDKMLTGSELMMRFIQNSACLQALPIQDM